MPATAAEVLGTRPPAARATLLLFWDYDTQWGADRSRLPGGPRAWGPLEFPHTDRLLELHARYEVPCCFAVVGAAALPGPRPYHDPDQIRRIHAAGHEVASHAFRHEWLPALSGPALAATLRDSRDALEQCIGAPVISFVPPFNQPFDYPAGGSISLSERRSVPRSRTDLGTLCRSLAAEGYRFCRVAYRPWRERLREWAAGHRLDRPVPLTRIGGIACVRLTAPAGFDAPVRQVLARAIESGGIVTAYGHPHSIETPGPQHVDHLRPFLADVRALIDAGRLRVCRPRDLLTAQAAAREGAPEAIHA